MRSPPANKVLLPSVTSKVVFTLGDVDCKIIDCDCKSEVNINFEVSKNWSKPFFDIDCKVAVIAVKNTH